MSGLLPHPVLRGADLAALRHAVADALDRGCGSHSLTAHLRDALSRAHSAGLLVTVARGAQPTECPSDDEVAHHAALEQSWRAGREHLSASDVDDLDQDDVTAVLDAHTSDPASRQAFLAGWRGHPLSSTSQPDRAIPTADNGDPEAGTAADHPDPAVEVAAKHARAEIRQLFGRTRRPPASTDHALTEVTA